MQSDAGPAGAIDSAARCGVVYHIDASYFIFRAYHSMPPDMMDGDGNATHALYGFARFISDLLEQVRPERIGVAFDQSLRGETSFRYGIYPAYKANREAPPAALQRQILLCREFCRHLGLAEFASAQYEADDIIGTLAARARAAGLRNVFVTRDKDLSQLLRDEDVYWDYSGKRPLPLPRDRAALRRGSRVDRRFPGAHRRCGGQYSRGTRHRQKDRGRAVRGVRLARRAVCESRCHTCAQTARRGGGRRQAAAAQGGRLFGEKAHRHLLRCSARGHRG